MHNNAFTKKGMTLIEIMVALAIFAAGMLGVFALFPVGLAATKKANDLTEATILTQWLAEDLKRRDFTAVTTVGSDTNFTQNPYFRYRYTVTDTIVGGTTDLKRVEIIVSWTRKNETHSSTFVLYVPNMS